MQAYQIQYIGTSMQSTKVNKERKVKDILVTIEAPLGPLNLGYGPRCIRLGSFWLASCHPS